MVGGRAGRVAGLGRLVCRPQQLSTHARRRRQLIREWIVQLSVHSIPSLQSTQSTRRSTTTREVFRSVGHTVSYTVL
eukprot:COSAG02_NODE_3108_length_7351_cov_11.684225_2_plen_77_part_00